VSEGRGTTRPFELIGAPWIADPDAFAARMNALGLDGVRFRPIGFEPTFHKHAKQFCGGCQIHVLDRRAFRPVHAGVSLIAAFHDAAPDRFGWKSPPYEYEYEKTPIDVLWGSSELRVRIERGASMAEFADEWEDEAREFNRMRAEYLLY
jgi:uncharacterized protein YbbC (DUF1343 family)